MALLAWLPAHLSVLCEEYAQQFDVAGKVLFRVKREWDLVCIHDCPLQLTFGNHTSFRCRTINEKGRASFETVYTRELTILPPHVVKHVDYTFIHARVLISCGAHSQLVQIRETAHWVTRWFYEPRHHLVFFSRDSVFVFCEATSLGIRTFAGESRLLSGFTCAPITCVGVWRGERILAGCENGSVYVCDAGKNIQRDCKGITAGARYTAPASELYFVGGISKTHFLTASRNNVCLWDETPKVTATFLLTTNSIAEAWQTIDGQVILQEKNNNCFILSPCTESVTFLGNMFIACLQSRFITVQKGVVREHN